MAKDLYAILGVSKTATDDEIKKAFRRKARELHPDVNKAPDAEERFKELTKPMTCFPIPRSAAQYDRFGTVPGAASGPGGGGYQYVDFDDLFGGGFGGMAICSRASSAVLPAARRTYARKVAIWGVGLRLTLEEVAAGSKKEIVYDRLAPCEACSGTGMGEDGHEIDCPECGGRGRVVTVQHTFLGDMQTASTCRNCGGTRQGHREPLRGMRGPGPHPRSPARHRGGSRRHPRRPAAARGRLRRSGHAWAPRRATSS